MEIIGYVLRTEEEGKVLYYDFFREKWQEQLDLDCITKEHVAKNAARYKDTIIRVCLKVIAEKFL